MIARRTLWLVVVSTLISGAGHAGYFTDVTQAALGRSTDDPATDGWSNKVITADINGDGAVDILVANGGDYNAPGTPELSFAYVNNGDGTFTDESAAVFGAPGLTRVIKADDVDGDGDVDIFVGGAYQTACRLLINDGAGHFTDESAARIPQDAVSFGDAEFADVDGDGDLDIVAADWGDGDPFAVRGAPRLWMNDGTGHFVDESATRLPTTKTGMSWDLTIIDADDDLDLDVLVSCKACLDGGIYLENQGDGHFLDRSGLLPGEGNNYVYEPFDVDGDGDLDLFTVNDGPDVKERLLLNDLNGESGAFVDASTQLDDAANPAGADDNAVVFFDVDGDGDADALVGSLSAPDRVLLNDGAGHFTLAPEDAVDGPDTPGTLGVAVADLDGDHKLDLVMVQGEQAFGDHVYKGVDIAADTQPPFVSTPRLKDGAVYVRVHDWKSPTSRTDFGFIVARFVDAAGVCGDGVDNCVDVPLVHVGEQLWRAAIPEGTVAALPTSVSIAVVDAAGNQASSPPVAITSPVGRGRCLDECGGGCLGCNAASLAPSGAVLLVLFVVRRRRRGAL